MDVLDFIIKQLFRAFSFMRSTEILGLSLFSWCAGLSVTAFVLDAFLGGDDGVD